MRLGLHESKLTIAKNEFIIHFPKQTVVQLFSERQSRRKIFPPIQDQRSSMGTYRGEK